MLFVVEEAGYGTANSWFTLVSDFYNDSLGTDFSDFLDQCVQNVSSNGFWRAGMMWSSGNPLCVPNIGVLQGLQVKVEWCVFCSERCGEPKQEWLPTPFEDMEPSRKRHVALMRISLNVSIIIFYGVHEMSL